MQLSVSTSPSDPSLATLLPGAEPPCPANSAGHAASFGAQFPLLAPTPTAVPAGASAPIDLAPTWIGSTIPQPAAPPRLPSLPGKPAAPFAKLTPGILGDALPAPVANTGAAAAPGPAPATTAEPAGVRPTPPGARREETTSPTAVDSLSAEMAQILSVVPAPVNSAPVVLTLVETAPTPPAPTADATAKTPLTPSPSRSPTSPAIATADLRGGEIGPRSAPLRFARDSTVAPAEVPSAELRETSPAPSLPAADAVPGETLPAVRRFAPAEILSRQFAFAPLPTPTVDPASPYRASRADAFLTSPATPSPATSLPATSLPVVDATAITPPALPAPFSAPALSLSFPSAASLVQAAPPPQPPTPASETSVELSSALSSGAVDSTAVAPREFTPNFRAEKTSPVRGAKIAATGEIVSGGKNRDENLVNKTFVNVSSERVARSGAALGTDVAKSEVTMTAPFINHPSSAAVPGHAPVASVASVASGASVATEAADRSADFSSASVLAPETTGAAHRAVEAVLTAVERFSSGERHSVNLDFSVGGNDLNVRVELRADEVHATFLTDSPELRTALAHEWQAAHGATDSAERPLRLVAPVIAGHASSSSSTSSLLSSFSGGDSSSRQRESGARRSAADLAAVSGVRSSGARSSTLGAAADSTSASQVARSAPPTSHRLHTHA